jgi:preprotein translocase subunit SecG
MANIIAIIIFSSLALVVVIILYRKNKKDEKLINPDAEDAVDELMMNQQRRKDKI